MFDYKSDILESELVFNSVSGEEQNYYIAVKAYFDHI